MGMNLNNIMVTTMDCMFYKYGVMVFIIVVVDGNYLPYYIPVPHTTYYRIDNDICFWELMGGFGC